MLRKTKEPNILTSAAPRPRDNTILVKAIVLFGAPGSGKGTQAKMLTECLRIPHISTGDMLRDRIRTGAEKGSDVVATMLAGALVSDELVNWMVEERIVSLEAARGFVLDGYPRTLAQAQHLSGRLSERGIREVVIHLAVDYNVIIARLTGRRLCPRCGTVYNTITRPSRLAGVCDLDGAELIIREDDSEGVIRERLEAYYRQTHPVLEFYQTVGRRVVEVDASHDPPAIIFQKICQAMEADDRSKDRR